MNSHNGARTTPYSRTLMVQSVGQEGRAVRTVAADFGISDTTVLKSIKRA